MTTVNNENRETIGRGVFTSGKYSKRSNSLELDAKAAFVVQKYNADGTEFTTVSLNPDKKAEEFSAGDIKNLVVFDPKIPVPQIIGQPLVPPEIIVEDNSFSGTNKFVRYKVNNMEEATHLTKPNLEVTFTVPEYILY